MKFYLQHNLDKHFADGLPFKKMFLCETEVGKETILYATFFKSQPSITSWGDILRYVANLGYIIVNEDCDSLTPVDFLHMVQASYCFPKPIIANTQTYVDHEGLIFYLIKP